jgi:hypothetical protein
LISHFQEKRKEKGLGDRKREINLWQKKRRKKKKQ